MVGIATPAPAWHREAACRGLDPSLFFPEPGRTDDAAAAKAVCAACPHQAACLEEHLGEEHGIWAGTTPRERRQLRRDRQSSRARAITHGTEGGARAHRRRGEAPCDPCRLAQNAAKARRQARRRERAA